MIFLEKLKEKSPCPVEEITKSIGYTGWYIRSFFLTSSDGNIQINKSMTISEKEGTLAHEIGHARCDKRECKCYKNHNNLLIEVHAELYALHLLLRHRRKRAIRARFRRLQNDWGSGVFPEARGIIRKRRIYKRCQEFVKK